MPLPLTALEPRFMQHRVGIADKFLGRKQPDGSIQWGGFETDFLYHVATFGEAHGIWFDCPKCYVKNRGPRGTHAILIWFAGRPVPERLGRNKEGQTVRWNASGSGISDLTLTPSILQQGGCGWHGYITNGLATGDGVELWEASMLRVEEEKDEQKSEGGGPGHEQTPRNPARALQEQAEKASAQAGLEQAVGADKITGPYIVRELSVAQIKMLVDNGVAFELLPAEQSAPIIEPQPQPDVPPNPPLHGTVAGSIIADIREALIDFERAVVSEVRADTREIHDFVLDKWNEIRGHVQL